MENEQTQPLSNQMLASSARRKSAILLVVLIGLTIILLSLLSLLLFWLSREKAIKKSWLISPTPVLSPTPTQSPEEEEIESLDLGNFEKDFEIIENDLQQL